MEKWRSMLPDSIEKKYEIHNYNHALEILSQAYEAEYQEVLSALEKFSITIDDIMQPGGSESAIPKKLSAILRPRDWQEVKISGDLCVKLHRRNPSSESEFSIKNYIDGHNIDYVKGKVAIDMEWNSKDQTFDRDLYAFRAFYECGVISCGVIITRSEQLNPIFARLGIKQKYGASTTWMGKLLPRIQSGRHGGCPLLVVGILPGAITDLEER
ncbi:restriction endonuclease [Bacteroides sp. OttesenSCG-928-J23]|nr:restriction endonuclease [Bacteroides sp. OttesenSCG-928-J23]